MGDYKTKLPRDPEQPRSHGISYQEMLDEEVVPVPDALRSNTNTFLGSADLPVERYISQEFHDLEVNKMWNRTWQMVCRETEIPNVGDHVVYDIATWSIFVTRTETGEVKGYHNSCLHRGRQLKDENGQSDDIRCPFHGFSWNLDGSFKGSPCPWDFEHLSKEDLQLPEVRVDFWAGWVFINMDADAPSLEEYMGPEMRSHFERWSLENTFKALHVSRIIGCNWKVGFEAFIESWHSLDTHPQIVPYTADSNSQYDIYGENTSRTITAMGVPSPHTRNVTEQEVMDALAATSGRMAADEPVHQVPDGMSAREFMAEINYKEFSALAGVDLSEFATRSEVLDAILYSVFPNFAPWAGFNPNIVYRFRPNGDDPNTALMEVMLLMRFPEGTERPADVPCIELRPEQPWTDCEELGALGDVFEQDMKNVPFVQKGMRQSKKGAVSLGNYQEVRIRHLHQTIDKYVYGD
ncbi:aromatic ring-hydroxylating dioxygenase subunit alpha [Halieaceae bacterium IMCC14734]|uniref:Aromatic ring-hydroxylating dioxygenase subunit alpha n=1 Tax=Candidatus Litorirhabdus singularis TaxID=2518993 RepID=A0ABT3THP1_9GAMM|nr:aromatic ring-hydroxylating dioxygenase subunit alpha [Candidatus Litorirhabdus singularis]MCX2980939.1 aromatic ring-hydroxylating dioxygenase subunit alpha [Candidatus Litorirhabdus singularis]